MNQPEAQIETFTLNITYTDTFGGEANFSWAHKYSAILPQTASVAAVKRMAKRASGLAGIRGRWQSMGDCHMFYPGISCTVLIVEEASM